MEALRAWLLQLALAAVLGLAGLGAVLRARGPGVEERLPAVLLGLVPALAALAASLLHEAAIVVGLPPLMYSPLAQLAASLSGPLTWTVLLTAHYGGEAAGMCGASSRAARAIEAVLLGLGTLGLGQLAAWTLSQLGPGLSFAALSGALLAGLSGRVFVVPIVLFLPGVPVAVRALLWRSLGLLGALRHWRSEPPAALLLAASAALLLAVAPPPPPPALALAPEPVLALLALLYASYST